MWDDEREVGVLNDFDLAKFADQTGTGGQDNMGTVPFMALDLLSQQTFRGETPRLYRHEAESFAWVLIYLYLATAEGDDGQNYTISSGRLKRWFADWKYSHAERILHDWSEKDDPRATLAYPNARELVRTLHEYWVDWYLRRNKRRTKVVHQMIPTAEDGAPHEEPRDDQVFEELLTQNSLGLEGQKVDELVNKMKEEYCKIDWDSLVHSGHT